MPGGTAELIVSAAACALTSAPVVNTGSDGRLTIADVVSLDCVTPERRAEIGALLIARLDRSSTSLTREAIANLVRRRAPALTVTPGAASSSVIVIERERQAPSSAATACAEAILPISPGKALTSRNVRSAPCAAAAPLSQDVRYDRDDGVVRARAPIAAGDSLGRLMAPPTLAADAGEMLTFQVRMGPALIERTVEALQASTGGAVFVRDADGAVFAAPLATAAAP
jgi:hypothetical protein